MAEPARAELRPYQPTWADNLARLLLGDGRVSPERRRFVEGLLGTSGLGDTDELSLRTLLVPETAADVALMAAGPAGKLAGKAVGKGLAAAGGALLALEPGEAEAGLSGAGRKGGGNIVQRVADAVNPYKSASYGVSAGDNSLASRSTNLYNPTPKPQRSFGKDYPNGAETDAAGNLRYTIDNDPIGARFVVGRRVAGGADKALSPAEFDAIAEAITGRRTSTVPPSAFRRPGTVGEVVVNRYTKRPEVVRLSEKLTAEQLPDVYRHEIGHVVDQGVGEIPVLKNIEGALRTNYNDLNNPILAQARKMNPDVDVNRSSNFKGWGPESAKYRGDDIDRELIVEALRHYTVDPNSMKSLYPELAKYLRQVVNPHPEVSKIIQLNSLAGLLGLGAIGASHNGEAAPLREIMGIE